MVSTNTQMPSVWAAPWSRPYRIGIVVGDEPARLTREGILIALQRDGRCAIGDAAPLPGLSPDTIADVIANLKAGVVAIDGLGHGDVRPLAAVTPSLAWALWSAWTALTNVDDRRPAVRSAVLAGHDRPLPVGTVVKLKVGRHSVADDVERITRHRDAGHIIRLDGNRRLTAAQAIELAHVAGAALAFFEEPTMPQLRATLPPWIPIALDESITDDDDRREVVTRLMAGEPRPAAFVIKPSILAPRVTAEIIEIAQRSDIPIVVSSAFDSSIGRRNLVRAAAACAPAGVHGLGTSSVWLRDLAMAAGDVVTEADGRAAVGDDLTTAAIIDVRWERLR